MSPGSQSPAAGRLPSGPPAPSLFLSIACLCAPWLLFFSELFTEAWHNPAYQFALFAPFLLALLAYQRLSSGAPLLPYSLAPSSLATPSTPSTPAPFPSVPSPTPSMPTALPTSTPRPFSIFDSLFSFLLPALACFLPLLHLLFEANADWRLVLWAQALLCATLTLLLLHRLGGAPLLRAFAPLALLPLLCVPWPTALEKGLATSLQSLVSTVGIELTRLAGFSARPVGSLILLGNGGVVGIEEACSGLRSLVGNLFAAGILGEFFLLTTPSRLFLFAASLFFSLLFNLLRSLILILTAATAGAPSALLLHDTAGWSIFALSFLCLFLLGRTLQSFSPAPTAPSQAPRAPASPDAFHPRPFSIFDSRFSLSILFLALLGPLATPFYYPASSATLPSLTSPTAIGLPSSVRTSDAARFRPSLFFSAGDSWRWTSREGLYQLFFFRWDTPRLSRLGGAYHHPENCLPHTGWTLLDSSPVSSHLSPLSSPAALSHFANPSGEFATLLFIRFPADTSADPDHLSPSSRLSDFLHRRRLSSRATLQLSLVSTTAPSATTDQQLLSLVQNLLIR